MSDHEARQEQHAKWEVEFKRRLLNCAGDMAQKASEKRGIRSWLDRRLSQKIWWLAEIGRTGEAHALLVNAGYRIGLSFIRGEDF